MLGKICQVATSLLLCCDASLVLMLVVAPLAFPAFVEDAVLNWCHSYLPLRKSVMAVGLVLTIDVAARRRIQQHLDTLALLGEERELVVVRLRAL